MSNLTQHSLICQHPDQIAAEADGEVLMMQVESGNYYGLNEVASFIWNRLDEPKTVAELCAVIQAEFDVDEERCMADVLAFLGGMITDGLVLVVSPAEATPGEAGA